MAADQEVGGLTSKSQRASFAGLVVVATTLATGVASVLTPAATYYFKFSEETRAQRVAEVQALVTKAQARATESQVSENYLSRFAKDPEHADSFLRFVQCSSGDSRVQNWAIVERKGIEARLERRHGHIMESHVNIRHALDGIAAMSKNGLTEAWKEFNHSIEAGGAAWEGTKLGKFRVAYVRELPLWQSDAMGDLMVQASRQILLCHPSESAKKDSTCDVEALRSVIWKAQGLLEQEVATVEAFKASRDAFGESCPIKVEPGAPLKLALLGSFES